MSVAVQGEQYRPRQLACERSRIRKRSGRVVCRANNEDGGRANGAHGAWCDRRVRRPKAAWQDNPGEVAGDLGDAYRLSLTVSVIPGVQQERLRFLNLVQ